MDTFIKMADCPEIQGLWQPKVGDITVKLPDGFIHNVNKTDITCGYTDKWRQEIFTKYGRYVWLPTQSQLQEMVLEKKQTTLLEPVAKLCLEFDEFIHPDNYCLHGDNRESGMFNHEYCQECVVKGNLLFQQFTSMEQLWLAFVMKEKFNKTWNGEAWVNG